MKNLLEREHVKKLSSKGFPKFTKKKKEQVLPAKSPDGKKNFGIQAKLLVALVPIIIVVVGGIVLTVQSAVSEILLKKSDALLSANTDSVVSMVQAWMNDITATLDMQRDTLEYITMTPDEEKAYLRHSADPDSAFPGGIYFATTAGEFVHASYVPDSGYDPREKVWYKEGLLSNSFIFGSAYQDVITGENVVSASAALHYKNGGTRGVAAADIQLGAISDIVKQVQIEQTGGAFLIDANTNMIIGHRDEALVGTLLADQSANSFYADLTRLIAGGAFGLQTCKADGKEVCMDLEQVPGCNWITVTYAPKTEILQDLTTLTTLISVIAVVAIALMIALVFILIRRIVIVPVKKLDDVASRIADGDLTAKLDHRSNDEFGTLSSNFGKTVNRLHDYVDYIDEISTVLDEIAKGNLVFTLTHEYVGEFARIKTALENISVSLNETLAQINQASDQVSVGADQLSAGAQTLSQGAT